MQICELRPDIPAQHKSNSISDSLILCPFEIKGDFHLTKSLEHFVKYNACGSAARSNISLKFELTDCFL